MPINSKQLIKEKRKIILDILFENIIPNSRPDLFWNINMLTAEIRKHNIDDRIRINRFDIKKIIKSIEKNEGINLHIINNDLFVTFS